MEKLDVLAGANEISLEDLEAPSGAVLAGDVERLASALEGAFSLKLEDIPALLEIAGIGAPPETKPIPAHRLVLEGRAGEGKVSVARGRLKTGTGTVDLESAEGRVVVTFEVSEGPQVLVERIESAGNSAFHSKELLAFFEGKKSGFLGQGKLLYVDSEVQGAVSGIRGLYYGEGYLDAVVEKPEVTLQSRPDASHRLRADPRGDPVSHPGHSLPGGRPCPSLGVLGNPQARVARQTLLPTQTAF